jgi:hypothetical protein
MQILNFGRTAGLGIMAVVLAVPNFTLAQDTNSSAQSSTPQATAQQSSSSNGGWRRVGETNPSATPTYNGGPNSAQTSAPAGAEPQGFPQNQPPMQQAPPIPGKLTIQPGTYVTVRLNQALSSDKNQPGDAFAATLVRPIVVDGVLVASAGQTLGGRVTEAKKAGRVEGTSRLGITLTDLPVVDGQQVPVNAQLIERRGDTSYGRDAAAIGTTTAAGAAIGAGVGGAGGAAVGAGAGLLVSTVGVMFTRGKPTILYPETVLTFRIEQPATISTEHAPQAFRYVDPRDYQQQAPRLQTHGPGGPGYPPPPGGAYYGGYGPGYYPPYGYGYGYPYWGPGFGVFYGPRFGGRVFVRGRFR